MFCSSLIILYPLILTSKNNQVLRKNALPVGMRMVCFSRDKWYTPERHNLTAFKTNEIKLHSNMVFLINLALVTELGLAHHGKELSQIHPWTKIDKADLRIKQNLILFSPHKEEHSLPSQMLRPPKII